jgi:replicative DNA helicase
LSRDIFLRWLSPKVETTKLLWINAPAGFGKTILCAHIVEHLSATMDKPVGHFFFSSDHESRGDQFVAVRSWIAQVMSRNQDAFSLARDAWTAQQEQMTTVATRRDIVKLFGNVVRAVPGCTFIFGWPRRVH